MAKQLRWVKANSRAVDDAVEHSLPRFKHRSLKPAPCEAIEFVRYNGIEETPLIIAIINYR